MAKKQKQKKKRGCFTWFLYIIIAAAIFGSSGDKSSVTEDTGTKQTPTATAKAMATIQPTHTPIVIQTAKVTVAPTAAPTATPTAKPTSTPTAAPTATATVQPTETVAPTAEPLVITLKYPDLGEYGRYYTFNENVAKATAEDLNTVIQCFIPTGTYTLTNEGKYPTFVFIYSEETRITDAGWEEPVDAWSSGMLKVGDACEITIEEGHYIKLLTNDTFRLVQKNTK